MARIFEMCDSTVLRERNSFSPIAPLEWPSATKARTSSSRSLRSLSGPRSRLRVTSRETIVGSTTHSPSSMRRSASASTAMSETRSFSR